MNCYLFHIVKVPLLLYTWGKEQSCPGHEVGGGTEFCDCLDRFKRFPDCQNFGPGNAGSHKEGSFLIAQKSFFWKCFGLVAVKVLYVKQRLDCDMSNSFNGGDIGKKATLKKCRNWFLLSVGHPNLIKPYLSFTLPILTIFSPTSFNPTYWNNLT